MLKSAGFTVVLRFMETSTYKKTCPSTGLLSLEGRWRVVVILFIKRYEKVIKIDVL